jgi:hypothetical protein
MTPPMRETYPACAGDDPKSRTVLRKYAQKFTDKRAAGEYQALFDSLLQLQPSNQPETN